MTCYKPFVGIRYGFTGAVEIFPNGYEPGEKLKGNFQKIPIPCGHCIGCRLEKSATWADRLMCELKYHEKACFLTLTYDDDHLPQPMTINPVTGEYEKAQSGQSPLCKKDLQKFIQDLRNYVRRKYDRIMKDYENDKENKKPPDFERNIRYFAVGEYGDEDKTHRPHYHIILFGYDFGDDRILKYIDENDYMHFVSKSLYDKENTDKSIWKNGIIDIANVSWQDCAYVARYTTKKLYGKDASIYDDICYPAEFALMSRRPGIAAQYLNDHKEDYLRFGELVVPTKEGARNIRKNPYFDRLISEEAGHYDTEWRDIRKKRAERSKYYELARLERSELSYSEQNAVDLKSKEKAVERIKRNGEVNAKKIK